jgi:hypothetical protein
MELQQRINRAKRVFCTVLIMGCADHRLSIDIDLKGPLSADQNTNPITLDQLCSVPIDLLATATIPEDSFTTCNTCLWDISCKVGKRIRSVTSGQRHWIY